MTPLPPTLALPDALIAAGQSALGFLIETDPSVLFAAVATPDGFDVAQRVRHGAVSANRLAAITSALSSLSAAAAKELALGRPENLVLDAAEGRMLLIHMSVGPTHYILSVVASKEALLGKVLLSARECAQQFSRAMGAMTLRPPSP